MVYNVPVMPIIQEVTDSHNPGIEPRTEVANDFKQKLDGILSRTLTPDSIDAYADTALNDLIVVVDEAIKAYDSQSTNSFDSIKNEEDAAFEYFGLDNIEELLDHIADKADEIMLLDSLINRATVVGSVVLPTTPENQIVEGNGTYSSKESIQRTKTLLFILSNDFEIDVHDPEQLTITAGVLTNRMMRKQSYFMVEVPKLERTILICDEEGNVTYVFNSSVLEEHGLSRDDLLHLTKPELNDLIQNEPLLGKRVIYSDKFVTNMITTINNPKNGNSEDKEVKDAGQYLKPKAPEDALSISINGLRDELGVAHPTIAKAIKALGDTLGEVKAYKFGHQTAYGFNPEQRRLVENWLNANGYLAAKPSEGILSTRGLCDELRVAYPTITNAIKALGDTLGEVKAYKFGHQTAPGFSLEQQELIRQFLESKRSNIKK